MPYLSDGTYISDAIAQEMEDNMSMGGQAGAIFEQMYGGPIFTNDPTVTPTAQDMATASPEEMEAIVEQMGMEGYEKYFAQFDKSEIDAIKANFENQMGQLDLKSKNIIGDLSKKFTQQQEQERLIGSKRGFAGAGDTSLKFDKGIEEDLLKAQEGIGLQRESAELGQTEGIRSAYKAYEDKFYSQMANVESMRDSGGDSGGKK